LGIIVRHRVAACAEGKAIVPRLLVDQSMNEASLIAEHEDDVSWNHLILRYAVNSQEITGPYRRNHARSPSLHANHAARAKGLDDEAEFAIFSILLPQWHRWRHVTNCAGGTYTGNSSIELCRTLKPSSRRPFRNGIPDLDRAFWPHDVPLPFFP
jgi:hypothetical protein